MHAQSYNHNHNHAGVSTWVASWWVVLYDVIYTAVVGIHRRKSSTESAAIMTARHSDSVHNDMRFNHDHCWLLDETCDCVRIRTFVSLPISSFHLSPQSLHCYNLSPIISLQSSLTVETHASVYNTHVPCKTH